MTKLMNEKGRSTTTNGIGIGAVLAMILSWTANKSILWALFHGILGWFYVFYYVIWIRWTGCIF